MTFPHRLIRATDMQGQGIHLQLQVSIDLNDLVHGETRRLNQGELMINHHGSIGKPSENHRKTIGKWRFTLW